MRIKLILTGLQSVASSLCHWMVNVVDLLGFEPRPRSYLELAEYKPAVLPLHHRSLLVAREGLEPPRPLQALASKASMSSFHQRAIN